MMQKIVWVTTMLILSIRLDHSMQTLIPALTLFQKMQLQLQNCMHTKKNSGLPPHAIASVW